MPAIPTKPDTASITRAEYDQEDALSFTGLKELLKSPAHYQHWRNAVREETKALVIGAATHSAVLTPDIFKDAYAMAPECDRRTKEGKAVWEAAQSALKPGQRVLSFDDYQHVMDLADAVTKLWQPGHGAWNETPLFGTDRGTPIKGIPDSITADGWIYDLKTTSDGIDERSALRTILNYKYHVQAAHYIRLAQCHRSDILGHRIVLVEKDAPHGVAIYEIAGEVLQAGKDECARAYSLFDQCRAEGNWPTMLDRQGVVTLDTLPGSKAAKGVTVSF